jgi:hypothetical protein
MWQVDLREVAAGFAGKARRAGVSLGEWTLFLVGVAVLVAVLLFVQLR